MILKIINILYTSHLKVIWKLYHKHIRTYVFHELRDGIEKNTRFLKTTNDLENDLGVKERYLKKNSSSICSSLEPFYCHWYRRYTGGQVFARHPVHRVAKLSESQGLKPRQPHFILTCSGSWRQRANSRWKKSGDFSENRAVFLEEISNSTEMKAVD